MGNEGLGLFALIITEALEVLTQHNIRYVVLLAHDEAPDLGVVTNTHDDDATCALASGPSSSGDMKPLFSMSSSEAWLACGSFLVESSGPGSRGMIVSLAGVAPLAAVNTTLSPTWANAVWYGPLP